MWIISRNYNDEKMSNLMKLIAEEIGDRVASKIKVLTILREPPQEAMAQIREAETVLKNWNQTYCEVREVIFQSGRDNRWEFSKKLLFDRTDYMAKRCEDLCDVAQVLDHFRNILGSKLKVVTGDAQGIDAVIRRVESLVTPIETILFDVFNKGYVANWMAVMQKFNESVQVRQSCTAAPFPPCSCSAPLFGWNPRGASASPSACTAPLVCLHSSSRTTRSTSSTTHSTSSDPPRARSTCSKTSRTSSRGTPSTTRCSRSSQTCLTATPTRST